MNTISKEIRARVEEYLQVDLSIKGKKNEQIYARALYYGLCRRYTTLSYESMAKTVGQHHSTAIHSVKNIFNNLELWREQKYIDIYEIICNQIEPIKARLEKEAEEARDYIGLLDRNKQLNSLLQEALDELNNESNYIQKYIMVKTQFNYLKSCILKKNSLLTAKSFIKELENLNK